MCGLSVTVIAEWVYCAIVGVFTLSVSFFFVRVAFAERACILAFVAHFASPLWVRHFDFCTVLRVRECHAIPRFVHFKAGHARIADYITIRQFYGRTRSAIHDRDDTVAACCGFHSCGARVGETDVLSSVGRVAGDALHTLVVVLSGTKVDQCRRAKRAVGREVVLCNEVDEGRTVDLIAVVQG